MRKPGSFYIRASKTALSPEALNSPTSRNLLPARQLGSPATVAEFTYRCMVQEAQGHHLVGSNPARTLSERPKLVRQLNAYAESVRDLLDSSLVVAESHAQDILVALELQKQHGLLNNDSLNLAIARRHGIKDIATADL
jgi:predicted nucleic acid-binding protein